MMDDVKIPAEAIEYFLKRWEGIPAQFKDVAESTAKKQAYVWAKKYMYSGERTPRDTWRRLAKAVAQTPEEEERFFEIMDRGEFIPGGRIIYVLGTDRKATNSNCYMIPLLGDSLEAIGRLITEMMRTYSLGGGVGTDISILRPQGSPVNNSAETSTGAVSFMNLLSETTLTIGQHGRRGALIITIHAQHPDVFNFITIKDDLTKVQGANISVRIPDEVFEAAEQGNQIELWYPDLIRNASIRIVVNGQVKQESDVNGLFKKILRSLNYPNSLISLMTKEFEIQVRANNKMGPEDWAIYFVIPNHKDNLLIARKQEGVIERGPLVVINPLFGDFYEYPDHKWFLLWNEEMGYVELRKKRVYKRVDAKELLKAIADHAWMTGEPGVQYWGTMKRYSTTEYGGMNIVGTNPCLVKGTKIWDGNKWVNIEDGGKTFVSWKTGEKEVIRLITNAGYELICTPDHPVMLDDGTFIPAEETLGKKIAWQLPEVYRLEEPDEKYVLMGFLFGDGYLCANQQGVCVKLNPQREPEVAELLTKYGFTYEPSGAYYIHRNRIPFDADILKQRSHEKQIPQWIMEADQQIAASFLRGLFEANGSCNKHGQISLKTTSETLAKQVQILLAGLGIESWITRNKPARIKWHNGEYISRPSYNVQIAPHNGWKFKSAVGFLSQRKLNRIKPKGRLYNRSLKVISIEPIGISSVYDFKVTANKSSWKNAQGLIVHNCGELPLQAYGACLLGNVNVAAFVKQGSFDWQRFEEVIRMAVRFLDRVLDWGIGRHPLPEQNRQAKLTRRIGLGMTGLADAFIKLQIRYDSDAAITFAEKIARTLRDVAYDESTEMAKEEGPFPLYNPQEHLHQPFLQRIADQNPKLFKKIEQYGLRHASLLTIPPVGSGSIILGVSSGIEPIYSLGIMERRAIGKTYTMMHYTVLDWLTETKNTDFSQLPDYFVDISKIDYKKRVELQGVLQKYIDSAISSTINLPRNISKELVYELYLHGWKHGLKGLTIYREGSRDSVIKSKDEKKETERPKRIRPRKPSRLLDGKKFSFSTDYGNVHVMVHFEPGSDQPEETFIEIGKSGTFASNMTEAVGRLLSFIMRLHPYNKRIWEEAIEQLSEIKAYGSTRDPILGAIKSVPDGIAKAIQYLVLTRREEIRQKGKGQPTKPKPLKVMLEPELAAPVLEINRSHTDLDEQEENELKGQVTGEACPVCGGPMIYQNGCATCAYCGYTKCE